MEELLKEIEAARDEAKEKAKDTRDIDQRLNMISQVHAYGYCIARIKHHIDGN